MSIADFFPLEFNQVNLQLNNTRCLHDINFSLNADGVTAIVGGNGAGKTLLLKLCANLLQASSGQVIWRQHPQPPQITFVPQQPILLNRSVEDNVLYPLIKTKHVDPEACCEDALQWADIASLKKKPALNLSTGEKQLVALARAKALSPSILLLDEPSANLDPLRRDHIDALIEKMGNKDCKVIFTSHYMSQVKRLAHNVLIMKDGRLINTVTKEDFIKLYNLNNADLLL